MNCEATRQAPAAIRTRAAARAGVISALAAVAARTSSAPIRRTQRSSPATARKKSPSSGRSRGHSHPQALRHPYSRVSALETAVADSVEPARPPVEPLRQGADAPARRCYHRPSLRQFSLFLRRTLRRAPWGLFLRLITTTELRNHGTQLSTRENPEHRHHGAHRRR